MAKHPDFNLESPLNITRVALAPLCLSDLEPQLINTVNSVPAHHVRSRKTI